MTRNQNNVLILIVGAVLYIITFRIASNLIGLYVSHIKGPVTPIILFEQATIPFVFGYFLMKYFVKPTKFSPLLLLFLPIATMTVALISNYIEYGNINIEPLWLFLAAYSVQIIFIEFGSYVQRYKIK